MSRIWCSDNSSAGSERIAETFSISAREIRHPEPVFNAFSLPDVISLLRNATGRPLNWEHSGKFKNRRRSMGTAEFDAFDCRKARKAVSKPRRAAAWGGGCAKVELTTRATSKDPRGVRFFTEC